MGPKVVEGHGTIVISSNSARKSAIQSAMVNAIMECLAEGISDPEIIKARQLAAKERVNG